MSALIYRHYGIPTTFIGLDYDNVDISKAKQEHLRKKIKDAPNKGLLVIKGSSAPVINQMFAQNRTLRGIDFMVRSNEAFEKHVNPKADVVLIYNVGSEVSTNYNVSKQVLQALIRYYNTQNTLVVIETHFSKTDMLRNYDLNVSNFLTLQDKPDEVWV